jgi:hypothetical protein
MDQSRDPFFPPHFPYTGGTPQPQISILVAGDQVDHASVIENATGSFMNFHLALLVGHVIMTIDTRRRP